MSKVREDNINEEKKERVIKFMPSKILGLFILGVIFFSAVGLAAINLDVNDYYDFETNTHTTVLNSSHDVKCTGTGQLTPVNNARKLNNATGGNDDPIVTNYTNVMKGVWSQGIAKLKETAPSGANRYAYFVTNDWNYTHVYSKTVTESRCEFETPIISQIPYFFGTNYPSTYVNATVSWTNDDIIYFSFYDLGVMSDEWVGSSMRYKASTNELIHYNTTTKYSQYYYDTALEHLTSSECLLSGGYGNINFSEINQPEGTYDVFCVNSSISDRQYVGVFMLLTHGWETGSFRGVWLSTSYFNIYGVSHSPIKPAPNMPVTVTWTTTQPADSRVYYQYHPLSNVTFSGWTSIYSGTETVSHSIVIDGSYIINSYFYQYYVESIKAGTTVNDTNSGNYYNFTIGSAIPSTSWNETAGETPPVVPIAIDRLSQALGLTADMTLFMWGILILIICTGAALIASRNPVFGAVVFVVTAALLGVFGWIPYYIIIIVILGVAIVITKTLSGAFG